MLLRLEKMHFFTAPISEDTFYYCTSLTTVITSSDIVSIGDVAFWGCRSLSNISFAYNTTEFGEYAFNGCTSLTNVSLSSNVQVIGFGAFASCDNLVSIIVDDSNTNFMSKDGVLFKYKGSFLIQYPCGIKNVTYNNIPESVTTIGSEAFRGCMKLTSISHFPKISKSEPKISLDFFFLNECFLYFLPMSASTCKDARMWIGRFLELRSDPSTRDWAYDILQEESGLKINFLRLMFHREGLTDKRNNLHFALPPGRECTVVVVCLIYSRARNALQIRDFIIVASKMAKRQKGWPFFLVNLCQVFCERHADTLDNKRGTITSKNVAMNTW